MAHFSISLPNSMQARVSKGKVIKKTNKFPGMFFPWRKSNREEKAGYIVETGDKVVYHFIKTTEGKWPIVKEDGPTRAVKKNGRWVEIEENELTLAIKKAIDDYENKQ